MNLKKAETRFKRAWEKVTAGKVVPHVRVAPVAEEDQSTADLILQFDAFVSLAIEEYAVKAGCTSLGCFGMTMLVKVPTDWISAPTRLLMPDNAADRLHNALLDAGVEDWIDIRPTDDGAGLIAELIDTLTFGQLDALKVAYDVLFQELAQPVYTFVERGAVVAPSAAPLVDPSKVETRVRQAWAGAHGGKIASIEATDDPRLFFVNHPKPVPGLSRLMDHGLEWHFVTATRSSVRVMDDLWNKIVALQQMKDAAPPLVFNGDYVVEALAAPEAKTETAEVPAVEAPPAPVESDDVITLEMYNERRRELHEREAEIERLNADLARAEDRISTLQAAIRSLTPVKTEWQTLRISIKPEGSDAVPHERIAEEEAKGWTIHSTQYVVAGGFTLLVLMKREPTAPAIMPPKRVSVGTWSSSGHGEPVFPLNGSARYESMIQEMDEELAPIADALYASFRRIGATNG